MSETMIKQNWIATIIGIVIATFFTTSLLVGGGTYLYTKYQYENYYGVKMTEMENRIKQLESDISRVSYESASKSQSAYFRGVKDMCYLIDLTVLGITDSNFIEEDCGQVVTMAKEYNWYGNDPFKTINK